MAKRKSQKSEETPSFEEALLQLQEIVAELEEGTAGLEHSMHRFEEGVGLLRTCYQTLEQAEQKIELLTAVDEQGNLTTQPFDATASVEQKKRKPAKKKTTEEEEPDAQGGLF